MNQTAQPIVLLFDIDGTLIQSGGAGGGALLDALSQEFGIQDAKSVPVQGRTDLGIMNELLQIHGIEPSAEHRRKLSDRYFELLPAELSSRDGNLLPGVPELLEQLAAHPDICLAILSGNMPESARLKLEHFGLHNYFEFGIFGDLADRRPALAGPAWDRIREHMGAEVAGERVVIVGDTPLDVHLANEMQVLSLAVCTGGFDSAALADATRIDNDLSETNELLRWFANPTAQLP